FFFQAEDGIRDFHVTGVQTCALPILKWEGYCPAENYQYGFLKGIALSTEKGIKKWLVDLSNIKVVNPENQRWTQEVLIKKMNYSGIAQVAVINPQCPLASSSIKHMY